MTQCKECLCIFNDCSCHCCDHRCTTGGVGQILTKSSVNSILTALITEIEGLHIVKDHVMDTENDYDDGLMRASYNSALNDVIKIIKERV